MCEQCVEQWAEEPVLRMLYDNEMLLTLTDWGLLVKKFRIQLQSDGARPIVVLSVYSPVSVG